MKKLLNGKYIFPLCLILIFIALIIAIVPEGAVFGSHTDWLSQHVTLAETIRDACLEQRTLLPSWIRLGSGSNGFQFAYYGFLRPDILIGCLLPEIPMLYILTGYMLIVYLSSVLLFFIWLRTENIPSVLSFAGSVLFMTAGCLFHMHRQIMFVNYLPFLLLAFLCIKKRKTVLLPLCLCLICLSSFYFAISAFAAAGWYWYQQEGTRFWRSSFWKKYIPSAAAAVGLSAALLLPTALVLLEHGRGGDGFSLLKLAELFAPNPVLNNLLFNEYGMGLTFICLYPVLAGLACRKTRRDSLFFLLIGLFGVFSWILNGTLYARPKILIPLMPLVILHCVRYLSETALPLLAKNSPETPSPGKLPIFPFAVIFPVGLLWFSQEQFPWIMAEACILFLIVIIQRYLRVRHRDIKKISAVLLLMILIAPAGMYLTTAGTEDWVACSEVSAGFTPEELDHIDMDPLYHFDSLINPLESCNELPKAGITRSTMYSSVTSQPYSALYYDALMTPVRINNRVALLTSDNPFMLHLLGVRCLEAKADAVPAGYEVICQSGDNVIAENKNVLPSAYFTSDTISESWFERLGSLEKLAVITQKTVVDDNSFTSDVTSDGKNAEGKPERNEYMQEFFPELSLRSEDGSLPEGLTVRRSGDGFEITAARTCTLDLEISDPQTDNILLLGFEVKNRTLGAVVIDINGIRNKLSGPFAPYPNGNTRFEYQFSPASGQGISKLSVTFSKGHYTISDIQWHLCPTDLPGTKEYTPLILDQAPPTKQGTVLSGTLAAPADGYFATTIPVQNGLEILVDGKPSEIVTVNEAFAGTVLTQGTHRIEIRFSPPGKTAGIAVSILTASGCLIFFAARRRSRRVRTGSYEKGKNIHI